MAKTAFTITDFTGGVNAYKSSRSIEDTELSQIKGFKVEPGEISVIGDMKGAYTPSAASANTSVESGYGLFAFGHDYDSVGDLNPTNYLVFMDTLTQSFDIYSDSEDDTNDDAWVDSILDLGGTLAASNPFDAIIKPCIWMGENAFRISPGHFGSADSGGDLKGDADGSFAAEQNFGGFEAVVTDSNFNSKVVAGDTIVAGGQEMVALITASTALHAARNMTGTFTSPVAAATTDAANIVLDTRWRGIVSRKSFPQAGIVGTFTEWYSTFAHPRPPIRYHADLDMGTVDNSIIPFLAQLAVHDADITITGAISPTITVGYKNTVADPDGSWEGAEIHLYISALYDDVKQESHPHRITDTVFAVPLATELGIAVVVNYADSSIGSGAYQINKRCTGARIYYEDVTNEQGILYQLLEVDFEKGCKLPEASRYTDWEQHVANECVGSHADGYDATDRDSAADPVGAFIYPHPPKAFTFDMNSGFPAHINTHARYKTAAVANGRLFVGNVYQSGKADGDRMIGSPVHQFDILPEMEPYVNRVSAGDGDEIISLVAYSDRILQFKKRTLYIVNVGGEIGDEYLESQHRNMGIKNPSQACVTEFGVAWVNSGGVYLYDGSNILDLTTEKLKSVDTTDRPKALNVTESNIPIVGYHPGNKWLIVMPQSKIADANDVEAWIHDFKNKTWAYTNSFTTTDDFKSNLVATADDELVFAAGTNSSNTPDFFKYRAPAVNTAAAGLLLLTKQFDLGEPGTKKKLQGIYVTYSAAEDTKIEADVIYIHPTGTATDDLEEADSGTTYYTEALGFKSTSGAVRTVQLVPTTPVTNAYTFQLKLHNPDAVYPYGANFKLISLQFIYRAMGIR